MARGRVSFRFVLLGGFVAGALDILFAMSFWAVKANVPPMRILQSVAAGLLGRASFSGGWKTASLGAALHFFIAISMACTYFVLARRWPVLCRRPWTTGAVYGALLYWTMNFIVIPLSAAQRGSRDPLWVGLSVVVHIALIGTPIALATRRALS